MESVPVTATEQNTNELYALLWDCSADASKKSFRMQVDLRV